VTHRPEETAPVTSTDQPTDDAHDRPDDGVELSRAHPRGFDDVQDSIDQLDETDGTAATEHAPEDIDIYDARGRCLIVLPTPIGVVVRGFPAGDAASDVVELDRDNARGLTDALEWAVRAPARKPV
jgi:hypothetical protein